MAVGSGFGCCGTWRRWNHLVAPVGPSSSSSDNGAMFGTPTVAAGQDRKAADQAQLRADLARRLRKLQQVFDLDALRNEPLGSTEVVEYYENCHDAYRKYHSQAGAVHMALNDGDRFDPDGFFGQLRRMQARWQQPPAALLELAFGQGFNLEYLAERLPGCQVQGIDLTPAHVSIARQRLQRAGLQRVQLTLGDFHQLPYADAQFDDVFCIEAFCYATDLPRALGEVARVLKPGGCFTLFDGYLPVAPQVLASDDALAVELVARGMAIEGLQVLDPLLAQAQQAGLELAAMTALDTEVMPSLLRLERITGAVIRFPWLGRRALARRNRMRGRNVLAGYLMRNAVAQGLISYRHLVLRKER